MYRLVLLAAVVAPATAFAQVAPAPSTPPPSTPPAASPPPPPAATPSPTPNGQSTFEDPDGGTDRSALAALVPVPSDRAGHEPGFVTMDRFDATSRFGVEGSYLFTKSASDTAGASVSVARFDAHGEWVAPGLGLGGYIQMPLAYIDESIPATPSVSATAIGDLEIGAVYLPVRTAMVAVVVRAGVTLPTASTSVNDAVANTFAGVARVNDLYDNVPDGFSGRFSGSLLLRNGPVFARADIGVDTNFSAASNSTVDTDVRLNAGVGYQRGHGAAMVESVNLYSDGSSSSWLDEIAVSLRYRGTQTQPYVAVVIPLDHESREIMDAALTFGLDFTLQH